MHQALQDYLHEVQRKYATERAREHAYRPALQKLLESTNDSLNAINDPKRIDIGMPDFQVLQKSNNVTIGIVEAKDIGENLDHVERSDQMKRYLTFGNLILTDYLEFRWYTGTDERMRVRIADVDGKGIRTHPDRFADLEHMLRSFAMHDLPTVHSARELAERMAAIAQEIRYSIQADLDSDEPSPEIVNQKEAFQKTLLPGLDNERFADMVAQTIAYGLFAARVNHQGDPKTFTRASAAYDIPRTNPFLRRLFHSMGFDLGERLTWLVDTLVDLLVRTDTDEVLKDFGRQTRQHDPVVHFYETFLSQYDPQMREQRGVYYTPGPVVSYIVRSVDHILKTTFGRSQGLADRDTLILDPATGTGTFLYFVIQHIYEQMVEIGGQRGMWSGYVREHLLPRLFGFELLMAPYTVAHMKLGIQLQETGYKLDSGERLGVYLTNTLEEGIEKPELPFAEFISAEANEAVRVKREEPIMVVLGNPPYSGHSENTGEWISNLVRDYYKVDGEPLGERNPKWLQDDYVKFIRFGQWRIEQTGSGILAFVTNHGYLDNPTFRGMRQQLMETFTDIYILDLHGNKRIRETAPDGSADDPVFDITQGVAIGIFVKQPNNNDVARMHHIDLWGRRADKYQWLLEHGIWEDAVSIEPQPPYYFFVPYNIDLAGEYEQNWQINDVFLSNSMGITGGRDSLVVGWSDREMINTVQDFVSLPTEVAREKYNLGADARDWKVSLAQADVRKHKPIAERIKPVTYRPFDVRKTYYTGQTRGFICMPRYEVMHHMLIGDNLALCFIRRSREQIVSNFYVAEHIVDKTILSSADNANVAPLYVYPEQREDELFSLEDDGSTWPLSEKGRRPNLNKDFVEEMAAKLGLAFVPEGGAFGPHPLNPPLHGVARGTSGVEPEVSDRAAAPSHKADSPPLQAVERGPGGEVETGAEPEVSDRAAAPSHKADSPPRQAVERGPGGEVKPIRGIAPSHELWEKLKPLARQKRHEPTEAEDHLWQQIRNRQIAGAKFRRQHAIDRFIVDFYCAERALVVEVDGEIHQYTQAEDAIRQEFLEGSGLQVLRFSNEAVLHDTEAVLKEIEAVVKGPHPLNPPLHGVARGTSADVGQDRHAVWGTTDADDESASARGADSPPLQAVERGSGGEVMTWFGPEDIFHYAYAIFHSPSYRERYAEFLKIDFPRLPLTSDVDLFRTLVEKGAALVALHLMKHPALDRLITTYPEEGDDVVERGYPRYDEQQCRVYINDTQYFTNVPQDVWDFHVGGYQVLDKWLKDRRGRTLNHDDQLHYQRIVVALKETIRLMDEIDSAIPAWPIE